jgi:hypothetical protein
MKYTFLFGLILAGLSLPTSVLAGTVVTIDENGNGSFVSTLPALGSGKLSSFIGGTPPTLAYDLGTIPVVLGDILIFEPGQQTPSDLLRWVQPAGQTHFFVLVYSDKDGGLGSPADVGVPAGPYSSNAVSLTETGLFGFPYSEAGPNGVTFTAGPNDPGFAGPVVAGSFVFISDTPEPSSIVLACLGGLAWAGYGLGRRNRIAMLLGAR